MKDQHDLYYAIVRHYVFKPDDEFYLEVVLHNHVTQFCILKKYRDAARRTNELMTGRIETFCHALEYDTKVPVNNPPTSHHTITFDSTTGEILRQDITDDRNISYEVTIKMVRLEALQMYIVTIPNRAAEQLLDAAREREDRLDRITDIL